MSGQFEFDGVIHEVADNGGAYVIFPWDIRAVFGKGRVNEAFTGKGYATEAVSAFLPVITGQVGVTEVYGIRLLENTASGRVLEKCGFQTFFTGAGAYHGGVHEISKSVWKA